MHLIGQPTRMIVQIPIVEFRKIVFSNYPSFLKITSLLSVTRFKNHNECKLYYPSITFNEILENENVFEQEFFMTLIRIKKEKSTHFLIQFLWWKLFTVIICKLSLLSHWHFIVYDNIHVISNIPWDPVFLSNYLLCPPRICT